MSRIARYVLRGTGALLLLLLLMVASAWLLLRGSLPELDGEVDSALLSGRVTVVRDALGVPTIAGQNRVDVAYATGYLHAQDRFFQMDTLRRSAAGELAELFGAGALPADRAIRINRFRARAGRTVQTLPASDRLMLERYAAGVNDGLAALHARPFEYLVLRSQPTPWKAEDSLLVIYAMYLELQRFQMPRALARSWLKSNVTAEQLAFLLPDASRYDAPLDSPGGPLELAAIPERAPNWFGMSGDANSRFVPPTSAGSNAYAISGTRTTTGGALVENDMHMGLRLPNIWYRARFLYDDSAGELRSITGVTLPGTPLMVIGSNGSVAWGLTNSFGEYVDVIELARDPDNPLRFRTYSGWEIATRYDELLRVSHGSLQTLAVVECSLGPIRQIGERFYAIHWVAHARGAANLNFRDMELAHDVEAAQAVANRSGMPALNMVVGDRAGHIGWTIAGTLPERVAMKPADFAFPIDASRTWQELRSPAEYPRVIDPPTGQLWSANSRQLLDDRDALGDGGADLGARAQQLRDDLSALRTVDERQAYGVILDDRALYMEPWRNRAIRVLDDATVRDHPDRAEFRRLLMEKWGGRADADSVGYRLARAYYDAIYLEMFGELDQRLRQSADGAVFALASRRWPVVAERLLDGEPPEWLPNGRKWRDLQLAAVDRAIRASLPSTQALSAATWGERNRAHIAHPFAFMLPGLGKYLSAPDDPLPGDDEMPRVAGPAYGATERLVVSPGKEELGIFNMPGGQSGNPLSPYFLAGHAAWVSGTPTALVPGATVHKLVFVPRGPHH